jgi:tetratricopeptide (TPR) repeat protein
MAARGSTPEAAADLPNPGRPASVPEHTLLRPIASGSYGVVWLAHNVVGTPRAVKIVRRDHFERAEDFEREFKGLQKFEPVSRSHEGLVDILSLGLLPDEAGFYYVMELADAAPSASEQGPIHDIRSEASGSEAAPLGTDPRIPGYLPLTLRAHFRARGALPAGEVLALGGALAAALAHLHGLGLVHRDIKPSNILFVGGVPKLADAGLVAAVDDARSLVGTAGYLAPEGTGSPRADLYALGKVLYEAAFGKDRQSFPQLPSDLATRPDHGRLLELNAIIATACAQDPRKRYASATAMLADLERLGAGKSVKRRKAILRLARAAGLVGGIALVALGLSLAARNGLLRRGSAAVPTQNWGYGTPTNQAALQAYTLGRARSEQFTPEGLAEGRKLYEESLRLEPGCALTWSGLAANWRGEAGSGTTLGREAYPRVRELGLQALRLAPDLDVGHEKLGWVASALDYDWLAAERSFRRAIQCNPDNLQVRESLVYGLLVPLARTQEAQSEVQTVFRLAVLNGASGESSRGLTLDARASYFARDFERALKLQDQLVELNPRSRDQRLWRARVLEALGRFPEAIAGYESLLADASSLDLEGQAGLAVALAHAGQTNAARARLAELLPHGGEARAAVSLAWVYAALGEQNEALRWLDTGYDRRDPWMIWLKVDPRFDALRQEQGFHDLLKRMRLE